MTRILLWALAVSVLFPLFSNQSGFAEDDLNDGNALLKQCNAMVMERGKMNVGDYMDGMFCMGYVSGFSTRATPTIGE